MNPKEKATLIVHKIYGTLFHTNAEPAHVKQCALIAVDEILVMIGGQWKLHAQRNFWTEVKKEIEKL